MRSKVIAITGGIGSGKSTVCEILKKQGYKVFSADEIYSELLLDSEFVKGVHLSVGLKEESKTLLREKVSSIVFSDKDKLKALNEFTHEKIMSEMFKKSKGLEISFHEVPLLFESGLESRYDKVIVVTRPIDERIASVVKRSGLTDEEVKKRIENQKSYENLKGLEHTVINNDKDLLSLERELKAVVNEIIG